MKSRVMRVVALLAGWGFVVLGIVGLFLPILQGVLFILVGLTILSSEYVWAHHLLRHLSERFPRTAAHAQRARTKVAAWLHRLGHRPGGD